MPFYIDMQEPQQPSFVPLKTDEEKMAQWQESQRQHYLMPGRTVKRTYGLNYQFVLMEVMGHYFELPDEEFRDLDDEARNEMTMRAKEMGLKTWDRDIARFIESPRIEKFDPVNTWLDSLKPWDGQDRIAELAARVPTTIRSR